MKPKSQILPISNNDLQSERELGLSHSSFEDELLLFNLIKSGDSEKLQTEIEKYFSKEIVMGRMTGNNMRQVQYWAVATIAVAVHYAILGGLDQTDAFNASDKAIRKVDICHNAQEIFDILVEEAVKLAEKVKNAKLAQAKTILIQKCLHFIHLNLNSKITLEQLSNELNVSTAYICRKFKQEMKLSVSQYIMKEKLEYAKSKLMEGESISNVSFELSFCSESHFIECFKKQFGQPPGKILNSAT